MSGYNRPPSQPLARFDVRPNCPIESNIDKFLERTVEYVKTTSLAHKESSKSSSNVVNCGVSRIPSLSFLQQHSAPISQHPSPYLASSLANLSLASTSDAARQVALCKQRSRSTNKQLLNELSQSSRSHHVAPSDTSTIKESEASTHNASFSHRDTSSYPTNSLKTSIDAHPPTVPTAAPAYTPITLNTSTEAQRSSSATRSPAYSGSTAYSRDTSIASSRIPASSTSGMMPTNSTSVVAPASTTARQDAVARLADTGSSVRDDNIYNRPRNLYKRDDKTATPTKLSHSKNRLSDSLASSTSALDHRPPSLNPAESKTNTSESEADMSVDDFLSRYVDNNDERDVAQRQSNNMNHSDSLAFTASTILPFDDDEVLNLSTNFTNTDKAPVFSSPGVSTGFNTAANISISASGRAESKRTSGPSKIVNDAYGDYMDIEAMYDDHHNHDDNFDDRRRDVLNTSSYSRNMSSVDNKNNASTNVNTRVNAQIASQSTTNAVNLNVATHSSINDSIAGSAAVGSTVTASAPAKRGLYRRAAASSNMSSADASNNYNNASNPPTTTASITNSYTPSINSQPSTAPIASTNLYTRNTANNSYNSYNSYNSQQTTTTSSSSSSSSSYYTPTTANLTPTAPTNALSPTNTHNHSHNHDHSHNHAVQDLRGGHRQCADDDDEEDGDLTDPAVLKRWQGEFPWSKHLRELNLEHFGITKFRPLQEECINAVLSSKDVFVLIPTGGGKSLCYQLATLAKTGFTVVISPLVSLMEDQVRQLKEASIESALITAATTWEETMAIRNLAEQGRLQLLYLTPEKLANSSNMVSWLKKMYDQGLFDMIAIDEAHCVSQWGHDFRDDYLKLSMIKDYFPDIMIMALTATATPTVIQSVIDVLGMRDCQVFRRSFNRANLYYEVREKAGSFAKFIDEVADYITTNHNKDSGIVYCLSRKNCEDMALGLQKKHITAAFYHAEMADEEKRRVQLQWTAGKPRVICATIAFGMGINKPDVRYVIHASMPKSMEGYYQESGRAGRDGLPADCILYYNGQDLKLLQSMLEKTHSSGQSRGKSRFEADAVKRGNKDRLSRMYDFCKEQFECRRVMTLRYFDQQFSRELCRNMCDNCFQSRASVEIDVSVLASRLCRLLSQVHMQNPQHCTKTITAALVTGKKAASMAFLDRFGYASLPDYAFGKSAKWGNSQFTTKHVDELLMAAEKEQLIRRTIKNKMIFGKGINTVSEMIGVTNKGLEWVQAMERCLNDPNRVDYDPGSNTVSGKTAVLSSSGGLSRIPGLQLLVKSVVNARTAAKLTKKQKEAEEKAATPKKVAAKAKRDTSAVPYPSDTIVSNESVAASAGTGARSGLYSRAKARVASSADQATASTSSAVAAKTTPAYRRIGATIAIDDDNFDNIAAPSPDDNLYDGDDDVNTSTFHVELVTGSQLSREKVQRGGIWDNDSQDAAVDAPAPGKSRSAVTFDDDDIDDEDEDAAEDEQEYNELYNRLLALSEQIKQLTGTTYGHDTIGELVRARPLTLEAMVSVPKMGRARMKKFGKVILCVMYQFLHEKNPDIYAIPDAYQMSKMPLYMEEMQKMVNKGEQKDIVDKVDLVQIRKKKNPNTMVPSQSLSTDSGTFNVQFSSPSKSSTRADDDSDNIGSRLSETPHSIDEDGFLRPKPHFPDTGKANNYKSNLARFGIVPDSLDVSPNKFPFVDAKTGQPSRAGVRSSPFAAASSSNTSGHTSGVATSWLSGMSPGKVSSRENTPNSGTKRRAEDDAVGSAEKRQRPS